MSDKNIRAGGEYRGRDGIGHVGGNNVTALENGVETFWTNSQIKVRCHHCGETFTVHASDLI